MADTIDGAAGQPSGSDSASSDDFHTDDGAIEIIVTGDTQPGADALPTREAADPDDDPSDSVDGGETDDPIEKEIADVRKPKIKERMRQYAAEAYEANRQREAIAAERDQIAQAFLAEQSRRVAAERQAVDNQLGALQRHTQWLEDQHRMAAEQGDAVKLAQITTAMAQTSTQISQLAGVRQQMPQPGAQQPFPQQRQQMPQQAPAQQQRPMEPMAARWLDDHKDWHQNNPQRLYAVGVEAQKLLRAGYPPGDPEHYRRLNRVLAAQHDDFRPVTRQGAAERGNGSSVVAPASRGPAGSGAKQAIAISAEEHAYLKRNGLLPTTNKAGFLEWKANRDHIAKSGALDQRGKIAIEIAA